MKIAVAMSGGVDSSVAAYLLKKQGHEIIGIFMHLWADPEFSEAENKCCSLESREDARRVAKKLNIPFYTLNLSKEFKRIIVNDFIKQYKKGLTPNPCIRCNQFIKFNLLLKKIKKLNFDYLATGHYVKLKNNQLYQAKDKIKDQSYFLYQLKQQQIKHLIFPLANYTKKQVIEIAKKNKLIPENKKESQDVCFVPKNKLNLFLKKYIKNKKGDIIDINNNKILGKHNGIFYYTLGQRAGIGGQGPYYIVKKDLKKNILYVSNKNLDKNLYTKMIKIRSTNWISGQKSKFPLKCKAKCRYGQPLSDVKINNNSVQFQVSQRAVTPGQSIVFYKNKELIGGGIIQ
jgi:tRNA-specific 2-thiouridylase